MAQVRDQFDGHHSTVAIACVGACYVRSNSRPAHVTSQVRNICRKFSVELGELPPNDLFDKSSGAMIARKRQS
jgi:hypothetical protein